LSKTILLRALTIKSSDEKPAVIEALGQVAVTLEERT